jgi:hypothetical protein
MNEIDNSVQDIGIGVGLYAMAKIKNVARVAIVVGKYCACTA